MCDACSTIEQKIGPRFDEEALLLPGLDQSRDRRGVLRRHQPSCVCCSSSGMVCPSPGLDGAATECQLPASLLALCASASRSTGDSAPFRRSTAAQTSPVLTPRLMLLEGTPCGMCNEISIAHHVRHHCDSALPRRLTRMCTSCLPLHDES